MYGCESWTLKKAEHWRIDAFELWCWRRLSRVPWTARRSNQSILKEISPGVHWKDWCWSWNSSALATPCEGLIHWKRPWCWERLGAIEEWDDRGWDGWMASPTRWAWVWVNSGSWWWTEGTGLLHLMGLQRVGHDWATELNWTERYQTVRLTKLLPFIESCARPLQASHPATRKVTVRSPWGQQARNTAALMTQAQMYTLTSDLYKDMLLKDHYCFLILYF